MNQVLIIASLYGSKRVVGLARYLPEFGWQPTVITPPIHWNPTIITPKDYVIPPLPFDVIETDYRDNHKLLRGLLRVSTVGDAKIKVKQRLGANAQHSWVDRLFSMGGVFMNYPDAYRGWKQYALVAGDDYCSDHDVGAIISICPVTSHIVASALKRRHNIPWVADYPDLWSQNFNYSYGTVRRLIDRRLERKTMANVDAIVSSSGPCTDRLRILHNGKPSRTITLGYDPQEYDLPSVDPTPKFSLTYTGLIYAGKQTPRKLLVALSDLIRFDRIDRRDCDVRFYGPYLSWLDKEIGDLRLADVVRQVDTVPHGEVVDVQRRSQALILLDWDVSNETGAYTAKMFEYLGARRPVLAVGGAHGNAISDLLAKTGAGVHAPTVAEVKEALTKYYEDYKANGQVAYRGEESEVIKYSQRAMAGRFVRVLAGDVDGNDELPYV